MLRRQRTNSRLRRSNRDLVEDPRGGASPWERGGYGIPTRPPLRGLKKLRFLGGIRKKREKNIEEDTNKKGMRKARKI